MIGFQLSTGEVVTARIDQKVEFELNNPALDDDLIPGSHSLEVAIDDVDGNMIKLENANRHDKLTRNTVFDDVRLLLLGASQYQGKLVIRRIRETGVDAFLVINGFSVEILDTLLTDIDYGSDVNLGSSSAAITSAAAAYVTQNYPDVNFNFPMIYAPNLYNGEALGWASMDTADVWEDDRAYALRDLIRWTDGYVYVCVGATSAGENPSTAAAKWAVLESNCIINNWSDAFSVFLTNVATYAHTQNAHCLAPQLFDKFVLKKIESTIGYRIVGEFIEDALTDQSLLINTEVLDDMPTQVIVKAEQDCVYDANTNPFIISGNHPLGYNWNGYYLHFNNEITDPDDDWTVVDPILSSTTPPSFYTIHSEGVHRITLYLDVVNIGSPPCDINTYVNGVSVDLYQFNSAGIVTHTFEWFASYANIGHEITFKLWDSTLGGSFDIGPGSYVQIENLSANQYNAWNGVVHHANHVPDVTVRQYLLSLKKRFTLNVNLNFFEKTIELNYCKEILEREPNDFTDIIQDPVADVQQPQGLTITENPQVDVDHTDGAEYTIAATYSNYQAMLDATDDHALQDVVYMTNQFAYYRLGQDENGLLEWQFEASKLAPLIYGNGARQISMEDAPAQMKYLYNNGDMVLLPWLNTQGNTILFGGIESDKPIVHAIWHGLQDSEAGNYQYPFATGAKYDATGADIADIDLRLIDGLSESVWELYWKDWARKVDLSLQFESPADLNYKQIFQLDFNSPIRRRFVKYVMKRVLYEVDQNGNIDAEIQGVKIQP